MIKGILKCPLVPLWYLIALLDLEQSIIYSLADNRPEYTPNALGQYWSVGSTQKCSSAGVNVAGQRGLEGTSRPLGPARDRL